VGHAVRDDHPDGVHFVPLAAIGEPRLVAAAIAEYLGIRVEGTRSALDALADHFASRRALLIVDNLEQVSAVGPDLAALLERAPELTILATSRHALRVRGEQEHLVGPLEVPAASASLDEVAATSGARLFTARAREVHARFALTADNAPAVAELCRRLDGLPLALELAAARVRLLSPAVLLQRLGDHLDLGSTRTDLPPRQRTLRATIDWSHQLLDERERALFARFSVFRGVR
jgi:predicted ATPase